MPTTRSMAKAADAHPGELPEESAKGSATRGKAAVASASSSVVPAAPPPTRRLLPSGTRLPKKKGHAGVRPAAALGPSPPRLNPLHVPELLDLVLSFVAVDGSFDSAILRTSRAFCRALRPRLYHDIDVSAPSRRLSDLLLCLDLLEDEALVALDIRSLRIRVTARKAKKNLLGSLAHFFETRSSAWVRLECLEARIEPLDDEDVESHCAGGLARAVGQLGNIRRLVLKGLVNSDNEQIFFEVFTACLSLYHSADQLANLSIELPAHAFFHGDVAGNLAVVGEARTFFNSPSMALETCFDCSLSWALLCMLLRCLVIHAGPAPEDDEDDDEGGLGILGFKTLVLGPALKRWIARAGCSPEEKKEWALAQRMIKEKAADFGCTVVWPEGLDLAHYLADDPIAAAFSLDELFEAWDDGLWPGAV